MEHLCLVLIELLTIYTGDSKTLKDHFILYYNLVDGTLIFHKGMPDDFLIKIKQVALQNMNH